jgi:ATP-dependent helicase/nuclease subunit B
LIAEAGGFADKRVPASAATDFKYWSFAKDDGEFGKRETPMKVGRATTGLLPAEFLPHHTEKLALAIREYIKGREPFTARENPDYKGYTDYDQLMRLEEWLVRLTDKGSGA